MSRTEYFLSEKRLLLGPWQAFERDVARLLLANGFDDVRLVGRPGDRGADILASYHGQLWVIQCKHTTTGPPPRTALQEVINAGRFYGADQLVVATSRPPSDAFRDELARHTRSGISIQIADPQTLLNLMSKTPEYPPSRHQLRDYQQQTSTRFREGLLDTSRGQIILATGLGKTVVMADVVADLLSDRLIAGGRVLVLAHTTELVNQLHRTFWYHLPSWVPTHQLTAGELPTYWDGITFATIQSAHSRAAELPYFGLLLVDEAHHIGATMFRDTIRCLSPKMIGGVTATPWRGDRYDIDDILGPPLVRIGISDGLQRGFLSEVDYRLYADNLDWEYVQESSQYNYSIAQLNRKLIIPTRDERAAQIIRTVFDVERRRGGIVFCPTIEHARSLSAMLRKYGLRSEDISHSNSPQERDLLMSRFRSGSLDFVTTVDLFNEGVDVPDVDIIVFMRATHSRRIFVQQLGRGLRISPNKDRVVVLDFVTDLRRVAEVIELDRATRDGSLERLGLGERLIQFTDASAGNFLREWMLDQASLFLREEDPEIELPHIEFPQPTRSGTVQ